jgi:hypothetical protein
MGSKTPQARAAKQPVREAARTAQITPRHGAASHAALSFASHIGNRRMGQWLAAHRIQTKLVLGPADDHYEREADQVADRVLRKPATEESTALRISSLRGAPVQRLCSECEEEKLQRKSEGSSLTPHSSSSSTAAPKDIDPALEGDIDSLRATGESLPKDVRTLLESRLGIDLNAVRVHADAQAGRTAQALNARAFTVGHHIGFAPGQYAPRSSSGLWLLTHEVTHVVQQTGPASDLANSQATAQTPNMAAHGVAPVFSSSPPTVQRDLMDNVADIANPSVAPEQGI